MGQTLSRKSVFFQLQKADLKKRQVWGKAAVEQPDSERPPEIMDYARSKPNFVHWSESVRKSSGGKSLGNVRAMHGGQFLAVGKVIAMSFDDAHRAVNIGVEVVDDSAWEKVQKGVYTGFSIGGSYGDRWPDPLIKGATRYEAIPSEVSLVDVPCMPGATFEVLKADGRKEMRKFVMNEVSQDSNDQEDEANNEEVTPPTQASGVRGSQKTTEPSDEGSAESSDSGEQEGESESEGTEDVEKSDPESDASALESEDAVEQQSFTMDDVRSMIVDVLLELGLVTPLNGVSQGSKPASENTIPEGEGALAMKGAHMRQNAAGVSALLQKVGKIDAIETRLSKAQGQLDPLIKQFGMMKSDLGKILDAIETLEKRGSGGPVVRDLGTINPQSMADMQKISVLRGMLNDANPSARQALQNEISQLEIKIIQTNKITL